MTTQTALLQLRAFIDQSPEDQRESLLAAFDSLTTTIAAQSLLIRNLSAQIRNSALSRADLDTLLGRKSLDELSVVTGRPISAGITFADAESAANDLASTLARGRDAAALLTAIARIVAVFV